MESQKEFNEKINEICKDGIMIVKKWWGHKYAGYSGKIVLNNKEIYEYQYYCATPANTDGFKNYIKKVKELSDEEYNRIIAFIENEIAGKEFINQKMFDAGYDLIINYGETNIKIENNKGFNGEMGIYDRAEMLLGELLNN